MNCLIENKYISGLSWFFSTPELSRKDLEFGVYSFQLKESWGLQKGFEKGLPTKNLVHEVVECFNYFLKRVQTGKQLRNESNHQKNRPLKSKCFILGGANIHYYLDVSGSRATWKTKEKRKNKQKKRKQTRKNNGKKIEEKKRKKHGKKTTEKIISKIGWRTLLRGGLLIFPGIGRT